MRLTVRRKKMIADGRIFVDPKVRSGSPYIKGVPTWIIKERYCEAKETIDEIAEDYGLSRKNVIDALEFEGVAVNVGVNESSGT
jgi:uncharacterized protein (DUF433 family)